MERGPPDGIDARTLHTVLGFAALAATAFAARERGLASWRARVSAPHVVTAARPPAPLGGPSPAHETSEARLDAILTAPPAPSRDAPVRGAIENVAALDGFYARLAAVEARTPRSMVRVAVYGDSVVADDKIPARIRARLQQRFGDGGPGFVLPSPPSRWYHHRDVALAAQGFTGHTVVQEVRPDGLFGYAGMAFEARDGGATTTLTLAPRAVSPAALRVSWWYLQRPGGGSFERREGNGPPTTVRTDAPTTAPAEHTQAAPGGVRELTLSTTPGRGPVRVYGAVLEREGPGVVVDNLGLVGSSAAALRRGDERFWQAHLARRGVDLVVFLLGANEAYRGSIDPERSQRTFEAMLAAVRGNPSIHCLVLAPLDEALVDGDAVVTRPTIPLLVEAQHRAALAQRCAFWNTFAWMGGRGSASRWNRSAWMEPDLVHPTAAGAVRVADAVVDALLAARPGATP
jgi:lysophospholipase L1-like esterase